LELNYRDRVARMTIVYYGPAASGKTTNLQVLHNAAQAEHRGDLVSVNSSQGRTILFDMLPLHGLGLAGWEVKFRLLAVPGQKAFKAARHLALRGADAVVFVANSADDRQRDNPESLRDLAEALAQHNLDAQLIPMALQYNKQDLPKVMSPEEMDRQLNDRGVPSLPAIAFRGEGVLETLAAIIEQVVVETSTRYRALALPPDTPAAVWTRENILRAFGTLSLAGRGTEGLPSPGQGTPTSEDRPAQEAREASAGWRVVRVGPPEARAVPTEDRTLPPSPSPLVGSYAQASVALGQAVEDLREQRDEARRFLTDLQHTLAAVEALAVEHEADSGLRALLARMATSARCRRGSLLTPAAGGTLRTTATLTPGGDILANQAEGAKVIATHLLRPALYVMSDPKTPADLRAALEGAEPPVHALASVPLRNVNSFHAVFLLYYGPTDPLPSHRELAHLDWMGRGLSASLHARRSLTQAREGWAAARGAVSGEAARRVLAAIEPLLGSSGTPGTNGLPDAARMAHAVRLLQLGRIESRSEALDAILDSLRRSGAQIDGETGLLVQGESPLLRLALEALLEIAVEGGASPLKVTARRLGNGLEIAVHASKPVAPPAKSDSRWLLARRVAELHGGGLEAAARAGAPAFTLRLPSA
jgi:signal recognition particle receptor subunit beta